MLGSIRTTTFSTSRRRNRTNKRDRSNNIANTKTILQHPSTGSTSPCHPSNSYQDFQLATDLTATANLGVNIAIPRQRQNPPPLSPNRSSRSAQLQWRQSVHSNTPRHRQPLLRLATCSPTPPPNPLTRPQDLSHKLDQRSRSAARRRRHRAGSLVGTTTCPRLPAAESDVHCCYAEFTAGVPFR